MRKNLKVRLELTPAEHDSLLSISRRLMDQGKGMTRPARYSSIKKLNAALEDSTELAVRRREIEKYGEQLDRESRR